jgi:hypothetical protein
MRDRRDRNRDDDFREQFGNFQSSGRGNYREDFRGDPPGVDPDGGRVWCGDSERHPADARERWQGSGGSRWDENDYRGRREAGARED